VRRRFVPSVVLLWLGVLPEWCRSLRNQRPGSHHDAGSGHDRQYGRLDEAAGGEREARGAGISAAQVQLNGVIIGPNQMHLPTVRPDQGYQDVPQDANHFLPG
jgi:hypothetical protein